MYARLHAVAIGVQERLLHTRLYESGDVGAHLVCAIACGGDLPQADAEPRRYAPPRTFGAVHSERNGYSQASEEEAIPHILYE